MAEVLRPMSTGELMDRTLGLYKRNFRLFVGIAVLGPATYLIFQLVTVGGASVPGAATGTAGLFSAGFMGVGVILGIAIMFAGMAIAHAATVKAVAAVHLGLPITVGGAYRALKCRLWRVIGVFLCMMLLGIAVFAVATIAATLIVAGLTALSIIGSGAREFRILGTVITFVSFLVVMIAATIVWVRYALSIACCVVEDLKVIASIKRSSSLSKGSRMRIFMIYFIFIILAALIGAAIGGLIGALTTVIPSPVTRLVLLYFVNFIVGALTGPLATIGIALVYYDERVRKEAFDIQWMMTTLDASAAAASAASVQS